MLNWQRIRTRAHTATQRRATTRRVTPVHGSRWTPSVNRLYRCLVMLAIFCCMASAVEDAQAADSGWARINAPGGKCVDVDGNDTGRNGAHVQMWDCLPDATDQFWHYDSASGALSTRGRCLDVVGNSTAPGAKLQLWDCNDMEGQVWRPQVNGSLLNPQSGLCVEDPGGSLTNGTQLELRGCNGSPTQRFPVSGEPIVPAIYGNSQGNHNTPVVYWTATSAAGYTQYWVDIRVDRLGKNLAHPTAWFWSNQQGFTGSPNGFYMGFQAGGADSHPTIALFSVFGDNAVVAAPNCVQGADGGAGVSCHVPFKWNVGSTYRFKAERTHADATQATWTGTVTDLASGVVTQIGSWTLPASAGLITTGNMSWAEWFSGDISCGARTDFQTFFSDPVGVDTKGQVYIETFSGSSTGTCGNYLARPDGAIMAAGGTTN